MGIQDFRVSPAAASPDGNVIAGNYIGTDATGTRPLGNGSGNSSGIGIFLNNARQVQVVDNVISGNTFAGISIFGQAGVASTNNQVAGNLIGPAASGSALLGMGPATSATPSSGQQQLGVVINGSSGNTIDADQIVDNLAGVEITGIDADNPKGNPLNSGAVVDQVIDNLVAGNFIGIYLNQSTDN